VIKRDKRRYLALEIVLKQSLNDRAVLNEILATFFRLFGEYGLSKANIKLIKSIPEKQQLVIRCSNSMLEKVRAAIVSTLEVQGKPVAIHVVGISGTLKALAKHT
jgi:ribonuclease P/MRP protein subunit POP5